MLNIGCHISISGGLENTGKNALSIGANTFQYFTRNPRGGKASNLDMKEVLKLQGIMEKNNFAPILAHGAYIMNFASKNKGVRDFAKEIFRDDLDRLAIIGNSNIVIHPGSHTGQGRDRGIELIIEALNEVIKEDDEINILLETMSGKGTEIGKNFMEIKEIINGVKYNKNLGVCLDTCHMFASGYDIVNDLDGVIEELDETIGLEKVKGIHLNDSLEDLGSNKDRHAAIGEGKIGKNAIVEFINRKEFEGIPIYLETPHNSLEGYKKEIIMLREEYKK